MTLRMIAKVSLLAGVGLLSACGNSSFRSSNPKTSVSPSAPPAAGAAAGSESKMSNSDALNIPAGSLEPGASGTNGETEATGAQGFENVVNLPGGSGLPGANANGVTGTGVGSGTGSGSGSQNVGANGSGSNSTPAVGGSNSGIPGGTSGVPGASGGSPTGGTASQPTQPSQPASPAPAPTPEQIVANACATKTILNETVEVVFTENTGQQCPFGQGDNSRTKDARLAARIERTFDVNIPSSRIVCSMTASTDKAQETRYDDHLFLMLNNNVLMTRSEAVMDLEVRGNGFREYNWSRLRDKGTNSRSNPFCADGVSCQLPESEKSGTFGFSMDSGANNRLFGSLLGSALQFRLVVTGDDNPSTDCQLFNTIRMKVRYSYVNR